MDPRPTSLTEAEETTNHLLESCRGKREATDALTGRVYDALKDMAHAALRREAPGHALSATDIVHEVYVKLIDQTRVDWKGRTHFLAISSRLMRRVLIDHARSEDAKKRGGRLARVSLTEAGRVLAGRA